MNNNRMTRYQFCRPQELARLRAWKIAEAAVAVRFATTPDGWRLAISHYRDPVRNPPTRSDFHHLSPLATLTHLLPNVPMHWPALFASKAAAFSKNMIASALVNPDNVDIDVYRKLAANLLHPVSPRVLRDLNGLMNGLGMKAANGSDYAQLLHASGYPFPILSLAGEADTQCPPASAARFGTQHQSFGRKHGHAIDYGHHDLIMGTHAEQEVWPCLGHWLAQHDRPVQAGIRRLG